MSQNSVKILERLLDFSSFKQKVISKNIANVATVDYKREEAKFNDVLLNELTPNLKTTDKRHLPNDAGTGNNSEFTVVKDQSTENTSGYNNVDVNREMADMAQNTLMFKFGSKKINAYYTTLQNVIRGGS